MNAANVRTNLNNALNTSIANGDFSPSPSAANITRILNSLVAELAAEEAQAARINKDILWQNEIAASAAQHRPPSQAIHV